MTMVEAAFTYDVEEYGVVSIEVDDPKNVEATETEIIDYVRNTYDDAKNITVDYVKEIK